MNRDLAWGFVVALALHGLVLFGLGNGLLSAPEFDIARGLGSVEVSLIAAMPAPSSPKEVARQAMMTPREIPQEDDMAISKPLHALDLPSPHPSNLPELPPRHTNPASVAGIQEGRDAATVQSAGGAESIAKPLYLRNPEPIYPEVSRRRGEEGVVILTVEVTVEGGPDIIIVKQTSGYPMLDASAVKAVSKWKFQPAKIAGIAVASRVDIPIRFQIR